MLLPRTPLAASDGFFAAVAGKAPIGRAGIPDDVAPAVLFLADGSKSGFTTGANIMMDGGSEWGDLEGAKRGQEGL